MREWDLTALRRHVGLVLQDVVLFAGSVAENLTLGRDLPRAAVEEVARRVHADPFIRALDGGYDAALLERGANLSHGQRQLLSVARALLYNPPVLVLDEATSSVDPETEHLLRDAVDQLLAGRTSMVIAHRLSTIQRADRVLVLQRGQLDRRRPPQRASRSGRALPHPLGAPVRPRRPRNRPGGRHDRAGMTSALRQRVNALVRRVPRGRVVTYGQVAALVGAPRAARAVGQAMRVCPAGGAVASRRERSRDGQPPRGRQRGAQPAAAPGGRGRPLRPGPDRPRALRLVQRAAVPDRRAGSARSCSDDAARHGSRPGGARGARRGERGDRARGERSHRRPGGDRVRRGRGTDREVARVPGRRRAHPGAGVRSEPGRRAPPGRAERPGCPSGRRRCRASRDRVRDRRRPAGRPSAGRSASSSIRTSSATSV